MNKGDRVVYFTLGLAVGFASWVALATWYDRREELDEIDSDPNNGTCFEVPILHERRGDTGC